MASIIRIKRSEVSGNPSVLGQGELAYSALPDNGSNGGDRLYIGMGTETAGNAVNHVVIGGKYFTDKLDHTPGVLTASSAVIVDANSKIDQLKVDNLTIDGNTISATDANGNIILDPNGNGSVSVTSPTTLALGSNSVNVFQVVDSAGVGLFEVKQNGDAVIGGVLTVSGDGTSTFTGSVDIGGNLTVDGDATVNAALSGTSLTLTGNLVVNGNTTLGNETTDTVALTARVASDVLPSATNTYDLGATGSRWAEVWATQAVAGNLQLSGNTLASTNANGDVVIDPNGTGTVNVSSSRITNVSDPVNPQDAATKAYVDAVKQGLDPKDSVRAATTANITLSGTQTVDGVALVAGNRVLVKNQTTASENGIYVVAAGAWTRASDFDSNSDVTSGAFAFVEEGTVNADSGWVLTTNSPITVGTTALSFTQFSGAGQVDAGAGLTKTGNTLDVNVAAAGGIEIVSDALQLKATVAGDGLTYSSGVLAVVGTANRITVGADSIDIASTYVGQTSITTLGTVTTGTWQGTIVSPTYGGTGVNNGTKTITLGGNFTHTGAHTLTLATTANTSVTLPTTGTLATLAGTETLTNKTITGATISGGSINNTPIGATTRSTGAFTTLTANGATTLTAGTASTSTTTGTLVVTGGVGISGAINVGGNVTGSGTSLLDGFVMDGGTY